MVTPVSTSWQAPFPLQVAQGLIDGHRFILRVGINSDLDVGSTESLWSQGGLYVFPPTASTMTVSSTSALDTAAGTGVRTVLVQGLDANYVEIQEIVTLNGTAGVVTANSYLRCHDIICLTAGSTQTQQGDIYWGTGTVTAGIPAVIYATAKIGFNNSQQINYTVPAGWTAYSVDVLISSSQVGASNSTTFAVRARPFGGLFQISRSAILSSGAIYVGSEGPGRIPEKADLDVILTSNDSNIQCAGQSRFLMIRNNLPNLL